MKKTCAIVLSLFLLFTFASFMTVSAEGESYTYELYGDAILEQDFEEQEAMEDYTTNHEKDPLTDHFYGVFSFIAGGGGAMITDQNPISGDHSLQLRRANDARRWGINGASLTGEAYAFEFMLRVDGVPDKFTIKISDENSPERDSESDANPVLSFKKTEDGKIGVHNVEDTQITVLELNKAYMLTVVCEVESNNYYLFLDGKYVENSKSTFVVEFKSPSALRIDTAGADAIVTFDDMVFDACSIEKAAAKPTAEPTAEATSTPTPVDATSTPKPAQATPTSGAAGSDSSSDFPTWAVISIAAGVVIIAAVVVIVIVKKKKK